MTETVARGLAAENEPELIRRQIAEFREQHPEIAVEEPAEPGHGHEFDLVVRARRMMSTAGIAAREIGIRDGKIVAIEPYGNNLDGLEVITVAEDEVLLPGIVDTHVHVNEPGRTDWEGFTTATKAAAAGGVTTIVDMPLNSIPSTVNAAALELKQLIAAPQAFIDIGFWGGAVPGNEQYLRELHDAGVFGFKCFLLHSGVDEFPHLEPDELESYLKTLQTFDALMIVHAEDSRAIDRAPKPDGDVYAHFLASRPRGAENLAIAEVIERTRWTGARTHVLHLSSSDALPMLRSAKADGLDITVETCPHYLTLLSEEIPNGATAYKCCPPIREVGNRELLWEGLLGRHDRLHRLRPLPRHAGPEGPAERRLLGGLGRHRVGPAGAAGDLDRGPPSRHRARPGGPVDGDQAGRPAPAALQGPARDRLRRRSGRLRARIRPSSSTRSSCTTATRSRRTRARCCPASSGRRTSAASRSTSRPRTAA